MTYLIRVTLVTIMFCALVGAQEPGGGGGGQQPGGGGGGGGGGGQPGSAPTPGRPTQPGQQQDRFPQDRNDPFNTDPFGRKQMGGKILNHPSMRLKVEIWLDGIRLDTTFTDMDGAFKFERLAQQNMNFGRYELHIDLGPGIEYVEEVDFRMAPVTIFIRPQGIRRDGPKQGEASGTVISLASLKVPNKARKEYEKGMKAAQKEKFDEALAYLRKATEIYPKYAEAFNSMGRVHRAQKRDDEARKAFESAIAADPDWVNSYLSLASLQLSANEPRNLLETSGQIVKLNPTLTAGHFFRISRWGRWRRRRRAGWKPTGTTTTSFRRSTWCWPRCTRKRATGTTR